MKNNRVECDKCSHFIEPVFDKKEPFISKRFVNAKCKLGKRVMFRIVGSKYQPKEVGWFRYCSEYQKAGSSNAPGFKQNNMKTN